MDERGRPQYDDYGESIIVGNGNTEDSLIITLMENLNLLISKITEDKSLRTHVLSVIVTNPGIKKRRDSGIFLETLVESISKTYCKVCN